MAYEAEIKKVLDQLRKHLGLGESPPGSNSNFIVDWYNAHVARIGNGAWCEMCATWAMWTGGAQALKRGRAYTPWGAEDGQNHINGSTWHLGTKGMRAGDQVYYNWSRKKGSPSYAEHTGIVEKISGSTFYALEGNIGDHLQREHRDGTYVIGYVRFDWAQLAKELDDFMAKLEYVSLGMSKPQAVKAGQITTAKFDLEYGDAGDAHAGEGKGRSEDNYPGVLSGGKNKTDLILLNVEVPEAFGTWRLIETDPKKDYAISKAYPIRKGPYSEGGVVEAGQHLYVELHPVVDGSVNVAVKGHYVDR